jgi:uncharacterized protein (DUF924 family)
MGRRAIACVMHAQDVLAFWFGEVDASGSAAPQAKARWWAKSEAFDAEVRTKFLADYEAIHRGERQEWLTSARGKLAYVIVLDQFSRNMFRGTPAMFASDPRALEAALSAIASGEHLTLGRDERSFFYLPLMHSESLSRQDQCIALFEQEQGAENSVSFAKQHRDIIARFGRFPHRNALLGRASTPDEEVFLAQPGSSF